MSNKEYTHSEDLKWLKDNEIYVLNEWINTYRIPNPLHLTLEQRERLRYIQNKYKFTFIVNQYYFCINTSYDFEEEKIIQKSYRTDWYINKPYQTDLFITI